jgi:hypothetical protein
MEQNRIPYWHESGLGRFNPQRVCRYHIERSSIVGIFVKEEDFNELFDQYVSAVNQVQALTIVWASETKTTEPIFRLERGAAKDATVAPKRADMQVVYLVNDDGTLTGLYPAGLCHYCHQIFHWDNKEGGVHHPLQIHPDKRNCPNRGKWFKIGPMVEFVPECVDGEGCVQSCTHLRMDNNVTYCGKGVPSPPMPPG